MYPTNSQNSRPSVGGGPTPWATPQPAINNIGPTSQFGNPATFTAAANTQASDYDRIMAQYADLAKNFKDNPLSSSPITSSPIAPSSSVAPNSAASNPVAYSPTMAQTTPYAQSSDVTKSLSDLSNLADTGGYSEADKADIRARDVSPTRSIYANAQQSMERSKALSGGYSPNFNATTASMTRAEADQIGAINTNANAGIAQNVASNRLAAAPAYAGAAGSANAAKAAADQKNTDIINQINADNATRQTQTGEFNTSAENQINEANAARQAQVNEGNANRATSVSESNATRQAQVDEFNRQMALGVSEFNSSHASGAIQGQASLYGTTPALANTFGNQVVQAGQLGQSQQNINNQRLNTVANLGR